MTDILDTLKQKAFDGNPHIEKVWMTKSQAQDLYAYCIGLQHREPFDLEQHLFEPSRDRPLAAAAGVNLRKAGRAML